MHEVVLAITSVHLRSDNEDIDPAKVLMGLNFYGNLYKKLGEGGPIIGHEYLDILDRERPPIAWDAAAAEHLATLRDRGDRNKSKRHVVVRTIRNVRRASSA